MNHRCYNKANIEYHLYGGRGIMVCDEWRHSFQAFFDSLGPAPSASHSLDRIDNDKDYAPGNCRWATRLQQARNKRKCYTHKILTDNYGIAKTYTEWAADLGCSPERIAKRLCRGWSVHKSVHEPIDYTKSR